jgi:hypothetical protein
MRQSPLYKCSKKKPPLAMLFWSWSNVLLFTLHNQRHPAGLAEDAINKPWHPLPSKRITPDNTTRLLYVAYPVVLLFCYFEGGLGAYLEEAFCCFWYNEWGGSDHPIIENFLTAPGDMSLIAGPLEIVLGNVSFANIPKVLWWLMVIGLAMFMTPISGISEIRRETSYEIGGRSRLCMVTSLKYSWLYLEWHFGLFLGLCIGGWGGWDFCCQELQALV